MSKSDTVSAQVPSYIYQRLQEEARWRKRPVAEIIRWALEEYFRNHR